MADAQSASDLDVTSPDEIQVRDQRIRRATIGDRLALIRAQNADAATPSTLASQKIVLPGIQDD